MKRKTAEASAAPAVAMACGILLAVIFVDRCLRRVGGDGATPAPPTTSMRRTAATPAGEVPGVSDTEIVLGADCPLAGAYGAVYSMIPKASEAYFKYVNETQGGVCGRKIVYKVEDNGSDPAKALEAARKLVEQDKVFAMVGSVDDLPHQGNWDYLNEKGVPDLLVSAGGNRFGTDPQGHPWTVQMIPSYTIEGTFFGRYISENLPGKKIGVLYENSDQGIDELAGLKNGLDPDEERDRLRADLRGHRHQHHLSDGEPPERRRRGGHAGKHSRLHGSGDQGGRPARVEPRSGS